jgi:hypothetical protein
MQLMTLNALSAGLLVAVTSAGMAQELPRPPELLRTRFCIGSGNCPVVVHAPDGCDGRVLYGRVVGPHHTFCIFFGDSEFPDFLVSSIVSILSTSGLTILVAYCSACGINITGFFPVLRIFWAGPQPRAQGV